MKQTLVQAVSLIEMLLLIIIGILSNKIAELLQINGLLLFLLTLVAVTILAVITIIKTNTSDNTLEKNSNKPWNIKPTKGTVINLLQAIIYLPSVLLLSIGAFEYSKAMDDGWRAILSGSIVAGALLFAPIFLAQVKQEKQSILPITLGFTLAVIYAGIGMYLDFYPEFVNSHLFLLAIISAITFVGLKYVFVYYTILIPFGKWYNSLPDK